jgi:hypothetical protein
VIAAGEIPAGPVSTPWLVESLWSAHGVGLIGGAPKSCKTWLALDLAISVASATPALGRFNVQSAGPVLLYAAEDSAESVQERLFGIASARGLVLRSLDIGIILTPELRLDTERDRLRLRKTLDGRYPRLLILDPLVRLHRSDENSAAEMSSLLGELRALQREYDLAIVLVHHLRKNAPRAPDGQALRGSGDLHAWGDSNLYLRRDGGSRDGGELRLCVEHRAAPSLTPITIELAQRGPALALEVVDRRDPATPTPSSLDERIATALASTDAGSLPFAELRARCRVRAATLYQRLTVLAATGRIAKTDSGYRLAGG